MKTPEELDYATLGFSYTQTPFNVRCLYSNGKWNPIEVTSETTVPMHIASTALHYGQQAFEGLKAFRGKDGRVRVFRMQDNAKRMQRSAQYLQMAEPSVELFCDMVRQVVLRNIQYVPPMETGGSLYIRPVLFGVGPTVGVRPSQDYMLVVFVTPVGYYFQGGMRGLNVMVDRNHDRAASHGTGHVKAGGNYASSLKSGVEAHDKGFDSVLYLDPTEHKYVDECGAANFFGIKDNTYITPTSRSILPSITNMTLQQIARDLGLKVEQRQINFLDEIASFKECGACGTAAVLTPIASIFDPENQHTYNFESIGATTQKLYDTYRGIQNGLIEDSHNWNSIIE